MTATKKKPTSSKKTESAKAAAATETTDAKAVASIVDDAVAAGKETVETVTSANRETVETVVKAGNDAAKKTYDEAVSKSHEHVETVVKANIDAIRGIEDLIAANEAGFEAAIHANTVFAKGLESLATEWLGYARTSTEAQAAAVRAMLSAQSPAEFFAVQAEFAKAAFSASLDESRKLSVMSAEVFDATAKPVAEQAWKTTETLVTARAA